MAETTIALRLPVFVEGSSSAMIMKPTSLARTPSQARARNLIVNLGLIEYDTTAN